MKHLTLVQRYALKACLQCGASKSEVAEHLGVNRSTIIYRELKRNSRKTGNYNPDFAHELAQEQKERFCYHRKFTFGTQRLIARFLTEQQWSPEQIKGYCDLKGIEMVSTERIYQYIRQDKANGEKLYQQLRHQLKHRRRPISAKHQVIKNKTSIEQRPEIINDKGRFGDWEIELIVGKNNKGAILTLVERTTAMVMIHKLKEGKQAKGVAQTVVNMLLPYKDSVKSITSDNGSEFAQHQYIAEKLQTEFYFAHSYASWERGLSENSNKLIRQYIPKQSNFHNFDDEFIKQVQYKINRRPRKNLNFKTPKELFHKNVIFGT